MNRIKSKDYQGEAILVFIIYSSTKSVNIFIIIFLFKIIVIYFMFDVLYYNNTKLLIQLIGYLMNIGGLKR